MKHKATILILILAIFVVTFYVFSSYNESNNIPIVKTNPPVVSDPLPPQEGLPPEVESKRQAIYAAALSRDYEKLNQETSADFHYSFGGEYEGGFIGYLKLSLKDGGESAFDIIPTLLRLPYTYRNDLYTWPSVFTIEPSKWTQEDLKMMKTFLTDEQIESYREYGGYTYYRLGITPRGNWTFYLAGD